MFHFLKKKSKVAKLEKEYNALLSEAHRLSTSNRILSDEKMAAANVVLEEIKKMEVAEKKA